MGIKHRFRQRKSKHIRRSKISHRENDLTLLRLSSVFSLARLTKFLPTPQGDRLSMPINEIQCLVQYSYGGAILDHLKGLPDHDPRNLILFRGQSCLTFFKEECVALH